jgi:hypothetical protein
MTYIALDSQVARQVEAKPNIARLLKLRCGSGQHGQREIKDTHSDNLLQLERLHLATVVVGTGPFFLEHCEQLIKGWSWQRDGDNGGGDNKAMRNRVKGWRR